MITTYEGDAYFDLQYSGDGLDAATSIDADLLQPATKYYCYFNQGQNAGLIDGVQLTGQTSAAVILVKSVVITAGAVGTSDAIGVLLYEKVSGTISSGENLRVSTNTYAVAASGQLDAPIGMPARSIGYSVESNAMRFCMAGATPTTSAGTPASFGINMANGASVIISGWKNVKDFKMINAVSTSNAKANITVFF